MADTPLLTSYKTPVGIFELYVGEAKSDVDSLSAQNFGWRYCH